MDRNRALTGSDRTHNLGITNVWQLPVGPGRRWLNEKSALSRIFGGWQINNMISIMSGVPFSVFADGTSLNLPGSNQTADQVKPDVQKLGGTGRGTPYYDPTAFAEVTRHASAIPATTSCADRACSTGTSESCANSR
jgi:hypothetical protein